MDPAARVAAVPLELVRSDADETARETGGGMGLDAATAGDADLSLLKPGDGSGDREGGAGSVGIEGVEGREVLGVTEGLKPTLGGPRLALGIGAMILFGLSQESKKSSALLPPFAVPFEFPAVEAAEAPAKPSAVTGPDP